MKLKTTKNHSDPPEHCEACKDAAYRAGRDLVQMGTGFAKQREDTHWEYVGPFEVMRDEEE